MIIVFQSTNGKRKFCAKLARATELIKKEILNAISAVPGQNSLNNTLLTHLNKALRLCNNLANISSATKTKRKKKIKYVECTKEDLNEYKQEKSLTSWYKRHTVEFLDATFPAHTEN